MNWPFSAFSAKVLNSVYCNNWKPIEILKSIKLGFFYKNCFKQKTVKTHQILQFFFKKACFCNSDCYTSLWAAHADL